MIKRRGEIYTAAMGGGYGGKPRPVLVIQSDLYGELPKTVVALIASRTVDAPSYRIPVEPTPENGLMVSSEVQPDIIMTVRWDQFGVYCGRLEDAVMQSVNQRLLEFLGFNQR